MKVTVNFGRTRVVVPCKDGWFVRDLMEQATQRYRKIAEQDGEVRVRTHHVEYADGGILDPDDMLTDLVEDRDKLVAVFEELDVQQRAAVSPGGSVASGRSSSPERPDPEISALMPASGSEIEVTSSALKSNTPLLVRSSSDSALAVPQELEVPDPRRSPDSSPPPPPPALAPPPPPALVLAPAPATGDSHAAVSQPQSKGGAMERMRNPKIHHSTMTRTVEFSGDLGPLGIKVVPYCSSLSGRSLGLHVCGLEDSGRAKREGIFQEDECIVQINDTPLMDKSFTQSQEVFRQAMTAPSPVRLEVLPLSNKLRYEKSLISQLFTGDGSGAENFAKPRSPLLLRPKLEALRETPDATPPPRSPDLPAAAPAVAPGPAPAPAPVAPVVPPVVAPAPVRAATPQREEPPVRSTPELPRSASSTPPRASSASPTLAKGRSDSPLSKKGPAGLSTLVNLANKKGGKKMKIDLKKGTEGLGFTVVTRDSSVHGPGPILVKSILQKGAAIKDGRLQSGDRILEVNGVDITGRTQEELVAMLRSTKLGESVSMVVARQEEMFLPRELKGEQTGVPLSEEGREQLMFEVPLSDSGSAGLGVSLKGNKSRETGEDLGIFIKSIIHGGAAYKDGRLRVNDQLMAINGESLVGRSNHDAMETLRRSMSMEGNLRGTIQLLVSRSSPAQEPVEVMSNQNLRPESPQLSQPPMVVNSIYDSAPASLRSSNGSYEPPEEDYDDGGFPPPPSHLMVESNMPQATYDAERGPREHSPYSSYRLPEQQPQSLPNYNRNSKSMDLVPDESNVGSLAGPAAGAAAGAGEALGPGLGLQKSSSLESLQTAMAEVGKAEVPFHRPATHMVRGRGCNQSFRFAIDKSYDGPSEPDDDDYSDETSGGDTPSQELDDGGKKKKKKKKKDKKKDKSKSDDPEKKPKRKFGLLRFGKKNKDKAKGKLEALSEEELDRKTEGSRSEVDSPTPDRVLLPDVEDDDLDPNYARINNFRQPPVSAAAVAQSPYLAHAPSPTLAHVPSHSRESSSEDPREGLYAKVNKQRAPPSAVTDSNGERLQQIRRDLQHMRSAPAYEEVESLRRPPQDYDPSRIPMSAADQRMAPRYEDVYAHQRRMPAVDDRAPQPYSPKRDPARYPAPAPQYNYPPQRETYQLNYQPSYPLRESYSMPDSYPGRQVQQAPGSPRLPVPRSAELERRYRPSPAYPSPPPVHRVPLRQDVPPSSSPTLALRGAPRYEQVARGGYRTASPDRYGAYGEASAHPQDPRQKNSLIGAV
ncbi:par-3 family cell polarity regulator beta a [Sardina pilchardus]|uniref:par-3 family cell polarity regulator beta a n=1 Tax=Sardina pilchardus TaxID=27697 RepID=UPI002E1149B7